MKDDPGFNDCQIILPDSLFGSISIPNFLDIINASFKVFPLKLGILIMSDSEKFE